MKRLHSFLILFLLFGLYSKGQYFSTGEDPANIKWREISTVHFRLIYPESFEENALRMANYFEKVYHIGSQTLDHKPAKISIVFHTQTIRSNGLVAWAPRRMEIFTPPHQAIYAQDWLEQLAIHEFRHVVQIDRINSQLPQILKVVFGEHVSALVTGAYIPFWFLEGDAVVSETALSHFGRGRLPSFLMEHKAQVVEKGIFSFDKAFNRSYKDFVPDHYKLGYLLVGESRARYGPEFYSSAFDRVARKPWSLTPFNRAIKSRTGMNQEQMYRSILDSLQHVWTEEDHSLRNIRFDTIRRSAATYTNYTHNHILPNGQYLSLKSGYDHIPHFVMMDKKGLEKKIFTPGQIFDESVGYRNNLVVWSEFIPDPRWTHSGRSQIRILNVEDLSERSFFPEYKCFAPDISPNEQYVSVVEVNFKNDYFLSIYNASTGALVKRYQTPSNNYLFRPVWINDNLLAAAILTKTGKELALINPFAGSTEILPGTSMGEIKHLAYQNGQLYFVSGYTGKDELWSYSLEDKTTTLMLEARFGLAYPAIGQNEEWILLSDYTANGYQLVAAQTDLYKPKEKNEVPRGVYPLADILASQEPGIIDFAESDTIRYNPASYKKGLNLFRFHSRAPAVVDVNTYNIRPGVSFVSQNILGTAETSIGYKWNTTEKRGKYFVNFEYKGSYPIVKLHAETGNRVSDYYEIQIFKNQAGEIVRQDTLKKQFTWNESDLRLGTRLPVNLTRGAYFRLIQPEINYQLTRYSHHASTPAGFILGDMHTIAYRLYFHQIRKQAVRDVLPDFGVISEVSFRHSPIGDIAVGTLLSGQIRTFLPGMAKNHGTTLYVGMQQRNRGEKYGFSDAIRMPRGWHSLMNNSLTAFSMEYRMPLFYPDRNIGRWVYFRRVKAAVFGDFAHLTGNIYKNGAVEGQFSRNLTSVGIDLTSDINILRLYAPADAGFRTTYLPEQKKIGFEFLFSIDFTSF